MRPKREHDRNLGFAGLIPVRGVDIGVGGASMGKTDKKGGFAEGKPEPVRKAIQNCPFFVTAKYQSPGEKLKLEDVRVMFLDVDIPSGKLLGNKPPAPLTFEP